MKNIIYLDTKTQQVKTSTFAQFDEAHFSHDNKPPGGKILIEMGMREMDRKISLKNDAVGYDLYSLKAYSIPPQHIGLIDTGLATKFPKGTYGRIASRSGLVLHKHVMVLGGVIDPDYTGNIKVLLYNFGSQPIDIASKDRIAQIILEKYTTSPIQVVQDLPSTKRSDKGFGSTGLNHTTPTPSSIIKNMSTIEPEPTAQPFQAAMTLEFIFAKPLYTTTVQIANKGNHATLGLRLQNDDKGPRIIHCIQGTPAAKIPQWCKILRNATLHAIDDIIIQHDSNISDIIKTRTTPSITLHVIPPAPVDIHPDTGVPQLHFDQFVHIAEVHQDILHDNPFSVIQAESDDPSQIQINKLSPNTFTRK